MRSMASKSSIIAALAATVLLLGGCDFFRIIAGRPTSSDIAAKKAMIEAEENAHKARLDSMESVKKQVSDSLAVLDSISNFSKSIVASRQLKPESKQALSAAYYVIVGSFSKEENARAFASKIKAEGYDPSLIAYKNGFTAVGICPSDNLNEVYSSLKKVSKEKFCPAGAWILNNR